jgi:UDP-glucose 4-epimerase
MQSIVKTVLIIGQDSYIGTRFASYTADRFNTVTVDARENRWLAEDMSAFDTVLHVAGIAHEKQKKDMKALYYQINCDLTVEAVKKAKASGVKQFIFLSSMSVLNDDPRDFYGGSKRKAEQELQKLSSPDFHICIVRPPMVYGPGCKGNFPRLVRLAKRVSIFPNIPNRRSMIYIDNLCEFLCQAIDKTVCGIFQPQNTEYINTTHLVQFIAACFNKKIRTTRFFNPLIYLLIKRVPSLYKLFGFLMYEHTGDEAEYNVTDYEESIRASVCTST